ncbi:hypothetical protein [Methylobacterium sp. WL6]|uniref:hypothetical protein n=1 Tax=Methylobacterium sp. WL6 TaxID=2603901 RepID=UPI0011C80272|nr:hypothetical protein [Methylobacterium sp. WL6]TXN63212.1 hypothetical protein FV230_20455 [Methylobacterium sp. WL6]
MERSLRNAQAAQKRAIVLDDPAALRRAIARTEAVVEALAMATSRGDHSAFAAGLAAYGRCLDACLDRATDEPECRDSFRRADAARRST